MSACRRRTFFLLWTLALAAVALLPRPAAAQDTHLLVITGVSGDEEHAKAFQGWATTFIEAAKKKDGVPDANIMYLAEKVEADAAHIRGRSTRENVEKAIADLAARARPNDQVVVLLIGHGSFDGRQAAFNLPGPDLTATDWAKLLGALAAQRVAFINTASSSGGFLPTVAAPGRTIVTATKTGGERNGTRFPEFFVEAFADEGADRDRNGHVSMLEAYDYARNKVVKAFEQDGLLLTEHATLNDGNDGKLAATAFLAPRPADGGLKVDTSDQEMRALLEQREALQQQLDGLKLRKEAMDAARYDQELERLLTELALKTRAIRDRQALKEKPEKKDGK